MTTKVNVDNSTGVIDYTGTTVVPAVAPTATGETMYVNSAGTGYISQSVSPTFKNRIINGNMAIDQRNNGAAVTAATNTPVYVVDRWLFYSYGDAQQTAQQVAVSDLPGFTYGLKLTGAAMSTAADAEQRIESANIADLAGKSVTLSFRAYNGTGASKTVDYYAYYPSVTNTFTGNDALYNRFALTRFTLPTGWSTQKYTFTADANVTQGMALRFAFGILGAVQYITLTGVQLEAGSVATDFELRPQQIELALCQRYYARLAADASGGGVDTFFGFGGATATSVAYIYCKYPQAMRRAPTVGGSGLRLFDGINTRAFSSFGSPSWCGSDSVTVRVNSVSLTTGRGYFLSANTVSTAYIDFSAEL